MCPRFLTREKEKPITFFSKHGRTHDPDDNSKPREGIDHYPRLRDKYAYSNTPPTLRTRISGLNAARVYKISGHEVKKHTGLTGSRRHLSLTASTPSPTTSRTGPKPDVNF